jgi:predicted NBD/HSP70 family sugar kinase
VELTGRRVAGLGLEIGVDYLAVRAVDLTGAERHQALERGDNRARAVDDVLDEVAALAAAALDSLADERLLAAGAVVALPGLVNSDGRLLVAPNLGWRDVFVPELLRERLGGPAFPIRADNEANLGALAELWEGAGRRIRDFVYVSGELGVGAGIIVDGELFRGARGFGGELGHVTVDPEGELCACGNRGCVETRVALGALLRAAGLDPAAGVDDLAARAEAGDARTLEALAEAGRWLGVGVASAANLLNPLGVVVGGSFAPLASWLAPGVREELDARVLSSQYDGPRVFASELGGDAAVRGAAAAALRRVFADPGLVAEL